MKLTILELSKKMALMGGIDLTINDKLTYAVKKNSTKIGGILKAKNEELQDKITDVNISFAQTGERGVLLTDEKGNFQYTADQQKKRNTRLRELYNDYEKQEIEIEPHFCAPCERIAELDLFLVEELTGILFDPETVEA